MATANSTCSIDGCPYAAHCRGWCRRHYTRVKNTGSPYRPCEKCGTDLPFGHPGKSRLCNACRVCTVPGCGGKMRRNGLCNSHASRKNRTGTTNVFCRNCGGVVPFEGFKDDQGSIAHYCSDECRPICSLPDCGSPAIARGYCKSHWRRFKSTGSPHRTCRGCGQNLPAYLDGRVVYCGDQCKPACDAPGCPGLAEDNGFCNRHGSRARYHSGTLPDLNYECSMCGTYVTRSYVDKQQRANTSLCAECRMKKARDHDWYRDEVLAAGKADCGICGESIDLTLRWPDPRSLSIDHILPISRGGTNNRYNLQPACLACNFRKHNTIAPPVEGALTLF